VGACLYFYHRMGKNHIDRARNASSHLWTMMNTRVGLTHRKLAMRSQFLCFEYVDQFGKVWLLLHFKVVKVQLVVVKCLSTLSLPAAYTAMCVASVEQNLEQKLISLLFVDNCSWNLVTIQLGQLVQRCLLKLSSSMATFRLCVWGGVRSIYTH
jgi:hypothetical protein